jgi:hypothetical protein
MSLTAATLLIDFSGVRSENLAISSFQSDVNTGQMTFTAANNYSTGQVAGIGADSNLQASAEL